MRKIFLLFLCVVLVLCLCACQQKNADIQEPVNFYYCRDEISYNTIDAVIFPEVREAIEFGGDPTKMLDSYLLGPKANNCISLIPTGTKLISFQIIDGVGYVKFSDEFAKLSGVSLSTACSSIVLTLHEYTGFDVFRFSANTKQLDNRDEIVVSVSDIILMDDGRKE